MIFEEKKKEKDNNMKVIFKSLKEIGEVFKHRGDNRPARLVKQAKVLTWSNEMLLETYLKQITIWEMTNGDVEVNAKYLYLVKSQKVNTNIKVLRMYV